MIMLPLMNSKFEPGTCIEYIKGIEEGPEQDLNKAEYYYFRGDATLAIKEAKKYLESDNLSYCFTATLVYAFANISIGNIIEAREGIKKIWESMPTQDSKEQEALWILCATAASVLLHLPVEQDKPPLKQYLKYLQPGIQMFGYYVLAHESYLKGEHYYSIGLAESVLFIYEDEYVIPAIYLHLLLAVSYMKVKKIDKANEEFLKAWELARKDGLLEAFGEHHGMLSGLVEKHLKHTYPEEYKHIIAITYQFSSGWRKIHNVDSGNKVADNLTTTEFSVAMMASRGWSNQEIAEHLEISAHTTRHYLSTIYQKLNITNRKQLKEYMLH